MSYLENIKQASKIKNLIFFHFLIINNSFSVYLKELLYLINYSAPKVTILHQKYPILFSLGAKPLFGILLYIRSVDTC